MTKQEILANIYNKLRFAGFVETQKDFAAKLDYNYTCLSSAMNGVDRYLTNRLFKRILKVYPVVNPAYINGRSDQILLEGDSEEPRIAVSGSTGSTPTEYAANIDKLVELLAQEKELTIKAQEQTDKALAQVDQLLEILQTMTKE